MTREDKLYTMRMTELAEVAEKLGIKIDKKGAKSKAIEKILDAESKVGSAEVEESKAGEGTPLAEVGKEIAEQSKQKAKEASNKSEKKSVPAKPKKVKKDSVDTVEVTESICKKLNLEYKRSRDGIGIFTEGKRVVDMWRRSDKIRVYVSSENPNFKKLDKKIVINLNDNPSKSSKLNKSFYVECANIEKMITALTK